MTRYPLSRAFALTFALTAAASSASAANWPWDETPGDDLEYCTGLVVGGLASNNVAEADRTELWLAWRYLVRSGAVHVERGEAFQEGRAKFATTLDAATIQANFDDADGSCGMGRSGWQITGW